MPFALSLPLVISGCESDLLNPAGDIAAQQRDLLIHSTLLMLLIIVPVMALTIWFAWRYRQSNKAARYEPEWHHSTQLELVIWAAPLLIIICLGALTWLGTHLLDPYRPVSRLAPGKPLTEDTTTLQVEVVALDWKWLFIYPQYGVATVNELAVPVHRPISLHITASSVMNSLYIPTLAGQVYAMPGMETKLHGVLGRVGESQGFSANYSGEGFSGMRLTLRGLTNSDFEHWVGKARSGNESLSREAYLQLAKPSEREPIRRYKSVDAGLYQAILNRCVEPNQLCMNEMMAIDARGGSGLSGVYNLAPLQQDAARRADPRKSYVTGICRINDDIGENNDSSVVVTDQTPLLGAGLTQPQFSARYRELRSAL